MARITPTISLIPDDLNKTLANAANTFRGEAEKDRAEAADLTRQLEALPPTFTDMAAGLRRQIKALGESAGRHDARAAAADRGQLVIFDSDHRDPLGWYLPNQELVRRCYAESRVRVQPDEAANVPTPVATA